MTDTTDYTTPLDSSIKKLEINPDYKNQAFKAIKNLVNGNKYNPEDVELISFEGEILNFSAYTLTTLITKRNKAIKPGRIKSAKKVKTEEEANLEMKRAYTALINDKSLEKNIQKIISDRPDKGFGKKIKNIYTQLPNLKKEFTIIEACKTCKSTGNIVCLPCNGQGHTICTQCKGKGQIICSHCGGAKIITMPGDTSKKIHCPACSGLGYKACTSCNQSGYILCEICTGNGYITCPNCQGTAWNSLLFTQEIQAHSNFYYPEENFPDKITTTIKRFKSNIDKHTIINIITDEKTISQWKEIQTQDNKHSPYYTITKNQQICFPTLYDVKLPYGHIKYSINKKNYCTFMIGKNIIPAHTTPFLDDLIANGIATLAKTTKQHKNIHKNLIEAAQYRTIKEGIILTAELPTKKATIKLKKANFLGLSNYAAKQIIRLSDMALRNITNKASMLARIITGLGYTFFFGIYFLTPVRIELSNKIPNSILHTTIDFMLFLIITYVGMIFIQTHTQSSLKKTLNTLLSEKIKLAPPKLGKALYWNIIISIAAFLCATEASHQIPETIPPQWYIALLNYLTF